MKNLLELAKYKMALIFALCMSTIAYAQEGATEVAVKTTNSSTTTTSTQWYTEPWVWVAGAVLFIILIAAIIGGRSSSTTRIERNTTVRDV